MESALIRTPTLGCFRPVQHPFGAYFLPVPDPEAHPEVGDEDVTRFHIRPDFPKIPADLWQRWARLCLSLAESGNKLEVSMRLLRSDDDPTQYRIVIPVQTVTGGSVDASFDNSRDIVTGEVIPSYPPPGWHGIGSCHSHHTMSISFSGGDDKSELSDPGLHMLIRSVNTRDRTYYLDARITTGGKAYPIEWDKVVDASKVEGVDFHPDVLLNIQEYRYQDNFWLDKYSNRLAMRQTAQKSDPVLFSHGEPLYCDKYGVDITTQAELLFALNEYQYVYSIATGAIYGWRYFYDEDNIPEPPLLWYDSDYVAPGTGSRHARPDDRATDIEQLIDAMYEKVDDILTDCDNNKAIALVLQRIIAELDELHTAYASPRPALPSAT